MNTAYTEDLGVIMASSRERHMVADLINAWNKEGLPDDFSDNGVKFAFNRNSGNVFLVNADYDVAMLNGTKLESFYSTPCAGIEGFFEELAEEYQNMTEDDKEYMRDIANGRTLPTLEK